MNRSMYVIAEIGSNHNGDMVLCRELVKAAALAGADAAKFQSWTESSLVSKPEYRRNVSYNDTKRHFGSLEEMVKKYQFTVDQHREIAAYCAELGIDFISSAFSPSEVDLLVDLAVPAIKIASMDINNYPLLRYIGRANVSVILSTGMSDIFEIGRALEELRVSGCSSITLLHCVSEYPTRPENTNLMNIPMLASTFGVGVGFSDHSLGIASAIASVALGARVIEKHFTLDRNLDGWDHHMSLEPNELKALCDGCKEVVVAMGSSQRVIGANEIEKRKAFRRSVVAARQLREGDVITWESLDFKRPGLGIPPSEAELLIGRRLKQSVGYDELVLYDDLV